jgi:hypothetical protein
LQAADPVDPQAAEVLEGLDRGAGAITEYPVGVDGPAAAEDGGQPMLDVRDCGTRVPQRKGKAYRYSAISWSS